MLMRILRYKATELRTSKSLQLFQNRNNSSIFCLPSQPAREIVWLGISCICVFAYYWAKKESLPGKK